MSPSSVNYTGTEDYFCGSYAFGQDAANFQKYQTPSGLYAGMFAVMGRPDVRYDTLTKFMMYRFHITDLVLFEHDFRMAIQDLGNFEWGRSPRRDNFQSVAYWYQTLPSAPLKPLPPLEDMLNQ